jgi:hypothetical protein
MKKKSTYFLLKHLCALLILIIFLGSCIQKADTPTQNCDGYTGDLKNEQAIKLSQRNHFMYQDSIHAWTERYALYKDKIANNKLPDQPNVFGDSSSFNHCIIKSILTNDSCIGLRVLYGMDAAFKVHAIFVGIKPDYTTLYIEKPKACNAKVSGEPKDSTGVAGGSGTGGAEYAMEP